MLPVLGCLASGGWRVGGAIRGSPETEAYSLSPWLDSFFGDRSGTPFGGETPSVSTAIKNGPELSLQHLMMGLDVMNISGLIKQANDGPHFMDPFYPHCSQTRRDYLGGLRP